MTLRILVTAPDLAPGALALLHAEGAQVDFVSLAGAVAEMEQKLAAAPYDGIISRFLPIAGTSIALCPSLRVISRAAVGYDSIDLATATARGIAVLTAVGANAQSVAEHAIGLMLAVARNIPRHNTAIQAGGWERPRLGIQMSGRCLGLVGYGQIAQATARMALAIGMRVVAWSPNLAARGDIAPVVRAESLAALLAAADVLSLHAPLNEASRHMIGAAELALLGPEGIVVNTARGGLIDEPALAAALREGRIFGAGLDVLSSEPPLPGHPLVGLPNAVLTPHIAAATQASRAVTAQMAATHALDVLLGRPLPPEFCVNPAVLRSPAG
jgi:D-3-phosphoglycerate dehydrogenase